MAVPQNAESTLQEELLADELSPPMGQLPGSTGITDVGALESNLQSEVTVSFTPRQIKRSFIKMFLCKQT